MSLPTYRVVIPSRYGSTRLPAKALEDVGGRPLVVRVWEAAQRSGASDVVVATDDERIREAAEAAGAVAVLTSPDHPTGTDRLAEVVEAFDWDDEVIVVNLQGDEPLVPAQLLDRLATALHDNSRAGVATVATPIPDAETLFRPSVVKCVVDENGFALYFSRAPIPWVRDAFATIEHQPTALPENHTFLRHLGLYGYRAGTLRRLADLPVSELERVESLEQLRALANGIAIHVTIVQDAPPHGVDTAEDLERVRRSFEAR